MIVENIPLPPVYYHAREASYWREDDAGGWIKINEKAAKNFVANYGYAKNPDGGEPNCEADDCLIKIQSSQNVAYVGPLAGHGAGIYEMAGNLVLVTNGPNFIQPKQGEWPVLNQLFEGMFVDGEFDQRPYFFGWLKMALLSFQNRHWKASQLLALVGERGSGKSVTQNLITELFGGRSRKPYRCMTGGTTFNSELFGGEHLMLEDESASVDIRSRIQFAANIKSLLVNWNQSCHGKHQEAVTLRPIWRMTLSLNDEPEHLLVLPPLTNDITDKIMALKVVKRPMPMMTDTVEGEMLFWRVFGWPGACGTYLGRLENSQAEHVTIGNTTSYTVGAGVLQPGTSYVWNMRASNSAGFSSYSSGTSGRFYFQTAAGETISTPGVISGQVNPIQGTGYTYTIGASTSSLGHTVEYSFNWGDGTSSAYSTSTSSLHSWATTGIKNIYVTARCQTHTSISANNSSAGYSVIVQPAPPGNDNFANRVSITAPNLTVTGSNVNATKESGEQNHAGVTGGKSVWWTWTPSSSGSATISTAGSAFDTLLGVYTGTSVSALSAIAGNDDDTAHGVSTSLVTINAVAGTAYQIAVDGNAGLSGSIQLTITPPVAPPANDNFANRVSITAPNLTVTGSNVNATKESGEQNHAGVNCLRLCW